MDKLVEYAFSNHIHFQDTKNKSFSYFMNKEFYAIQLAKFCDYEMKIGNKGNSNGVTLSVQVLQNGAWDIDKTKFEKVEIPKFLFRCLVDFNNFYTFRHSNRKLSWAYGLVY